jgi:hypothetical protein
MFLAAVISMSTNSMMGKVHAERILDSPLAAWLFLRSDSAHNNQSAHELMNRHGAKKQTLIPVGLTMGVLEAIN